MFCMFLFHVASLEKINGMTHADDKSFFLLCMNLAPRILDLSFGSPEENLACDEALFRECELNGSGTLRFWVPDRTFVVAGYTNVVDREVRMDICRSLHVPVLRRCTGGGAVVQMPGCLNYTLVLPYTAGSEFATIESTNRTIMETLRRAFALLHDTATVTIEGVSDLALNGMKFCGNAQRRGVSSLLFHGVVLCDADLESISRLLPMPSRQPGYRQNRPHARFLTNIKIPIDELKPVISRTWAAATVPFEPPWEAVRRLVDTKYKQDSWNFKR